MTYGDVAEVDDQDADEDETSAANDEFDQGAQAAVLDPEMDAQSVEDDDLEASFDDDDELASLDKVLNANAPATSTKGFNVRRALEEKFEMRRMNDFDDIDLDRDF